MNYAIGSFEISWGKTETLGTLAIYIELRTI